ncbi:MAG: hypothetical protein IPP99_05240 [Chitinophagaceae bacterium]|nr:hypothetical protein [Chitinophagaceae bacterium]
MQYRYDIYTPNDQENSSGTVSEKQAISYSEFERLFLSMQWDQYPASPTISIYKESDLPLLWVALFATSENEDKARMFIIGYKRMEEKKGFLGFGKPTLKEKMTMHHTVGNEGVVKLFREFFDYEPSAFLNALKEFDDDFNNKKGA